MKSSAWRKGLIFIIAAAGLSGWLAWAFGWEESIRMRRDLFQLEDLNGILLSDVRLFKERSDNAGVPEKTAALPSPTEGDPYTLRDRVKTQENMIADLRSHNAGLQKKLDELYTESLKKDGAASPVDLGTLAVSPDGAAFQERLQGGSGKSHVVSVDQKKAFVIIDLGKKSGLDKGMRFSAAKGNTQMAELEVIELRDTLAACRVAYSDPRNTLQPNDEIQLSRNE